MSRLGSSLAALRRPWQLLLTHRWLVLIGVLFVPVHAAISLWMPRLLGQTLDLLQRGAAAGAAADGAAAVLDTLRDTCLLLLVLALAESGARYISRKTLIDASRYVEQELKNELVAHLQRLPVPWFDRVRTGDITSRLTSDVELVRFVMGPLLLHGGSTLCLLPAGIWLMAQMNVPVTLTAMAAFGVLFVAMRILLPRLHRWSKTSQEAIAALSQQAQEDFAGIRVVQQFDRVDRERAAMATRNRRYLLANLRLVRLRSLVHALSHSTSGLVTFGVLLVGGMEVIGGAISVGELFQFTGYLALLTFPLEILGWTLATMPRAIAAAQRIQELLDTPPERREGARPELTGHIEVRDLTFTYPGAERPALANLSFVLPPGGKLGLVGPVGSGKSTLLAILLAFYEPPRGTVLIDGHDVLDLSPDAVRKVFAFAAQEPFLFSDTVANNVTFARESVDAELLADAVAAAALDQDLPQLPGGLQTIVGERGVTLSGGQKQRVALARALLDDRPGLLLDDTLSAVDTVTERRILRGLAAQRRDRTTIAASHRLSVIADADLILVLDRGAVVERGTLTTLLAENGRFAAAWRRQTEAEALETPSQEPAP